MKWIDLTEDLTQEGFDNLLVGQVLIFNHPKAGPIHIKIRRKSKGKIWGQRMYLYAPEEVDIVDKEKV